MGLEVYVLKQISLMCRTDAKAEWVEELQKYEDVALLSAPKHHLVDYLSKVKDGWWICEKVNDDSLQFSMPYSTYNNWIELIQEMAYVYPFKRLDEKISLREVDANDDFIPLFCFSDCEGCFDYEIAEVLLKHFDKWMNTAEEYLPEWAFINYQIYREMLKQCVDCKGVIFYT